MLFKFIRYVQPTSYFNLKRTKGLVFPNIKLLADVEIEKLEKDTSFKSLTATNLDLSWQAIQNGYTGDSEMLTEIGQIPLVDEYRFVRKYFNPVWASYCFGIRVLSLKNPITEFRAWFKTRNVKRKPHFYNTGNNMEWLSFDSELLKKSPKISVIIPTLNRYKYLNKVLEDFEKQDYTNFEILIVDQSDNFDMQFYNKFDLNIQLIRQEEKALWLARNSAIRKATGRIIALSEDDVRIESNWLSAHIKCLDFFKADISAGVFYPLGKQIPEENSFFSIASHFATGNAMLYKDVFKAVGLFNRQFERGRMGDGEFGLRCFLAGFKSISNPFASCIDVKANTGGLREMGSWDAYRPTNWFDPRPVPSVLYYYRKYFGKKLSILALLKSVPTSIIPYRFKRNKKLLRLGILLSIFAVPLIIVQVLRSWNLASKKLKQGALIDKLH